MGDEKERQSEIEQEQKEDIEEEPFKAPIEEEDEDDQDQELPDMGSGERAAPVGSGRGPLLTIALVTFIVGLLIGAAVSALIFGPDEEDGGDEGKEDNDIFIDLVHGNNITAQKPAAFTISIQGNEGEPQVIWAIEQTDGTDRSVTTGSLTETLVFVHSGDYRVNATVIVDGQVFYSESEFYVKPAQGSTGPRPVGRAPDWTITFEGVPGPGNLTLEEISNMQYLLQEVNITLLGVQRSLVVVSFIDLLDAANVRADAYELTVVGDRNFSSTVHKLISLPNSGGAPSYLAIASEGRWLNATDLGTPVVFIGPGPSDVVKDVRKVVFQPFRVHLEGPGIRASRSLTFDDMLEALTPQNYTVSNNLEQHDFSGWPIWGLLKIGGVLRNATGLEVIATDGYTVLFDIADVIDNPESDMPFFLAFNMDGQPLWREEGPYRLITPDSDYTEDDGHNWYSQTWIKQVLRLRVQSSGVPAPPLPSGDPLPGTLTIEWNGGSALYTSFEIASMWEHIVEINATLVKSTGARVEGTYAGIPLFDLLEEAEAPGHIGNLTFSASDGYSYYTDPYMLHTMEAEEGNITLIALTENGEWLPEGKGPFRSVSSALPSKGWVSGLSRIVLDDWALIVDGTQLTMADLLSLPQVTAMVTYKGAPVNYTGVDILDLGISGLVASIEVAGYDYSEGEVLPEGYAMNIDLLQYTSKPKGERPFLALKKEGALLSYGDSGPVRMIVPEQPSRYWVGSVKRITAYELELVLKNGTTYVNLTLEELAALPFALTDAGIVSIDEQNKTADHTISGVELSELLKHFFGSPLTGSISLTFLDGSSIIESTFNLSMPNSTVYLVWELDGSTLDIWNGLFALVISDDLMDDNLDRTERDWRMGAIMIEVVP